VRATATNTKAAWACVSALASFGAMGFAVWAARRYGGIRLEDALVAAPVAFVFGLLAVVLARRARAEHYRRLGRSGSRAFIALARILGTVAFLVAVTAALALAVFAALVLVLE
jgi:hypothetical protein